MTTRELLAKRWQRVWDALRDEGLDGLYVAGKGHILGYGPFHYLSGYMQVLRYAGALILPDREPSILVTTEAERVLITQRTGLEDVRCIPRPATAALEIMQAAHKGGYRLGVHDAENYLTVGDYLVLQNVSGDESVVDATAMFQALKTRKFPEEIAAMDRTYRIADDGFQTFIEHLRPGATGWELSAEIERTVRSRGVPDDLIFIGRGEHFLHWPDEQPLQTGDLVTCFVEVIGPEGYWVERGGMFSLGPPASAVQDLADCCLEGFNAGVNKLTAGTSAAEICSAIEIVARTGGYSSGIWHGHGVGVDHDTPFLAGGDETVLEEDMVVALHPNFSDTDSGLSASLADCFHITAGKPRHLSRFEPELRIVD